MPRKRRSADGLALQEMQRHILAWQTSAFLDGSLDLINTLDLAGKFSPSKEVFEAILDSVGFDTGAWDHDVNNLIETAGMEAGSIKGQVDGELIELDPRCLAVHLVSQARRLNYQEMGGPGPTTFVLNTDIQAADIDQLRLAMVEHLPRLKAMVDQDALEAITPEPNTAVVKLVGGRF